MSLKKDILNSCNICQGSGWVHNTACECLLKFRVYNRLLNAGFSRFLIEFVDNSSYQIPYLVSGQDFVEFFLKNSNFVEEKGLSLYLYSQDKGRGKTTLAHKIIFDTVQSFVHKDTYSSERSLHMSFIEPPYSSDTPLAVSFIYASTTSACAALK